MRQPVFNVFRRKVGGIWFLRIGRLQFSFCLCRPARDDFFWHVARHTPNYPGGKRVVLQPEVDHANIRT